MSFLNWNIISLVAVFAAMGGVLLVRKLANNDELKENHAVTDPMMNTVGMLFAILLGFMVASAMTRFEEARNNVQVEAGAVGDVFRLARGLPRPAGLPLMQNCSAYVDEVIDHEWTMMESEKSSDKAWEVYTDIWKGVTEYEPTTQGQSNIHQVLVGSMTTFGEARRSRVAQMQTRMPDVLWLVIFIGALVTLVFSFFFSLNNLKMQLAMTALLTYVLFMNLFLLISFNEPFSGDVRVGPAAFEVNRTVFHKVLGADVK